MELTTRCPECETVFPVSLEQLQLRKGYIRCIQCAHIFDGFEAAVPGAGPKAATPADTPPAPVEPTLPQHDSPGARPPVEPQELLAHRGFVIPDPVDFPNDSPEPAQPFIIGSGKSPAPSQAPTAEPSFSAGRSSPVQAEPDEPRIPVVVRQRDEFRAGAAPLSPSFTISEPSSARRPEPVMVADTADDSDDDSYLFIEPRAGRRPEHHKPGFAGESRQRAWMTPVWALLFICGLVLLAVQGVVVYRAQLANSLPSLRPVLETVCGRLNCSVPYERRLEAIAITGSALRSSGAPEGEVSNLILEVTLRNTHERPQEWPTLVLDLKDASGTVVVRRNLEPSVWVPETLRDGPFAADSQVQVQLPVAVRGLQANGYQLDKFFP